MPIPVENSINSGINLYNNLVKLSFPISKSANSCQKVNQYPTKFGRQTVKLTNSKQRRIPVKKSSKTRKNLNVKLKNSSVLLKQ